MNQVYELKIKKINLKNNMFLIVLTRVFYKTDKLDEASKEEIIEEYYLTEEQLNQWVSLLKTP